MTNGSQTFTGILGPDGKIIAGPAADDTEAIVYSSIDLDSIIRQKIHHDVAGNYNWFDVLSLGLNRTPLTAISELPAASSVESPTLSPPPSSDQPAESWLSARDQPIRGMSELDNEDDHGERTRSDACGVAFPPNCDQMSLRAGRSARGEALAVKRVRPRLPPVVM